MCIDWAKNSFGRHIYAGLGVYRDNIRKEITEQIYLTRTVHCQGQSFFRYENLLDLPGIALTYKYPALIPPMPWKDSIPPLPPTEITSVRTSDHTTLVRWKEPPPAVDGDVASQYVVYRSSNPEVDIDNARNILAVVPAISTMYLDDSPNNNIRYYYTVTALDRGHNESSDTSGLNAVANDHPASPGHNSLAQNYPNPFTDRTYISYELSQRCTVELSVKDTLDDKEVLIVSEVQDPGTYIVAVDANLLTKGKHTYQLRAGGFIATKYLERIE